MLPWPPAVRTLLSLGGLTVVPDTEATEERGAGRPLPALVLSTATLSPEMHSAEISGALGLCT